MQDPARSAFLWQPVRGRPGAKVRQILAARPHRDSAANPTQKYRAVVNQGHLSSLRDSQTDEPGKNRGRHLGEQITGHEGGFERVQNCEFSGAGPEPALESVSEPGCRGKASPLTDSSHRFFPQRKLARCPFETDAPDKRGNGFADGGLDRSREVAQGIAVFARELRFAL